MTKPRLIADSANSNSINGSRLVDSSVPSTKLSFQLTNELYVNVKDFGAVGNGFDDDTLAIMAAAESLQNGQTLFFGDGTYLISYQGDPYSSVNGFAVIDFIGKSDISIMGDNATIKVVNHDISEHGGFSFLNLEGCKRITISGFNFDMTYIGVNLSSSFYPFCGAIIASDGDLINPQQSDINGDFLIEKCSFKLFHPWGCWATSGSPYNGDPNNGYKLFPIFISGPFRDEAYESQCRNITVRRCTFEDGHNGYGIWIWSWNNILVENCSAINWVTKYSNNAGVIQGGAVPFIRYHQWRCSGITIRNNYLKSRPCDQRTVSGFEGTAGFLALTTNYTLPLETGSSIVEGNTIILGNGDGSINRSDYGIFVNLFGSIVISSNTFDSISTTANSAPNPINHPSCITYEQSAEGGFSSLIIDGNSFGRNLSFFENITCQSVSSISADSRRVQQLIVSNNTSRSQRSWFLRIGLGGTYQGVRQTIVTDNVIDGENNSVFGPASPNSFGILYWSNVANDMITTSGNSIRSKYFGIYKNSTAPSFNTYGNNFFDVTVPEA